MMHQDVDLMTWGDAKCAVGWALNVGSDKGNYNFSYYTMSNLL